MLTAQWFCPAHHPGDGACGPLSFSQQSYLYSSSAEVLIVSKNRNKLMAEKKEMQHCLSQVVIVSIELKGSTNY